MSKWKMIKLRDAFDLQMGRTPSRNNMAYWNDGANKWVSIADISSAGKYIYKTKETISDLAVAESGIKSVPKNTVIISFKLSLGKTCIVPEKIYTNEAIMAFIDKEKYDININYLYHLFKGKDWSVGTNKAVKGTTLNKTTLGDIKIPLPPLDTQKQIAKTLDTAAELLAMRKQQLSELDNLIKSVFYDMFGDPVINEKGWEVIKLPDFYENGRTSVKCGPFGSALKKEEYVENGIPVWVMDNITKQGDFINEVYLYITEEKYNVLESYNVQKNDIIISRAGTVGKMCVVTANYDKSIISTNLIRVRLSKELLPIYVVKLITIWENRVCRLKTGDDGSFTHMNTGVLDNITFPYPPFKIQTQFAEIVTKIEEQKALVKKAIDETQYLFDSLMSEYFD